VTGIYTNLLSIWPILAARSKVQRVSDKAGDAYGYPSFTNLHREANQDRKIYII